MPIDAAYGDGLADEAFAPVVKASRKRIMK